MRTTSLRAAVLAAFALGLPLAAAQSPSATAAQATQSAPSFDPVWGQYTGLVGANARAGTDGYELRWYWAAPGQELVQEYINPTTKKVTHREVIKPGATPGSLVLTSSALGKKQWLGTVQPDGRVLFIGKGLLKAPYLAGRTKDGAWELTPVDVEDGRVVAEKPASQYARFVPFDASAGAAAQVASASASTAPAAAAPAPAPAVAPAATATAAAATAGVAASTTAASPPAAAPAPVARPDTPEVALLRTVIEGIRAGAPPYDRMEPASADALRKWMAKTGQQRARIDEIRSIEAGWPMKPYRFLVMHGEHPVEWRMDLSKAGRITYLEYRAVSPAHVTAVRNFGTLAALVGKPFVHHNTRASFQLEQGGHVLVMTGNWGTVRLRRNGQGGLDVQPGPTHRAKKVLATMGRNGVLELELFYSGLQTRAQVWRHRISAKADGSGFKETQHHRMAGITLVNRDYSLKNENWFVPLNDKNVAEQKRYAAQARAEYQRQRAEKEAAWNDTFSGFMGGLQQAGQQYQQQLAQTRAFNEELQQMTHIAQERQRLEQEAKRRAQEADRRQAEAARIAATAPRTAPAPTTSTRSSAPASGASTPGPGRPAVSATAPAPAQPASASAPRGSASPMSSTSASDESACRMLPGRTVTQRSIPLSSREKAEAHVRGGANGACPLAYGKGTLGSITCTTESEPLVTVDSKGRTQKTGTRMMYTCSAPVTCPPVKHCQSRPAGGSRQ